MACIVARLANEETETQAPLKTKHTIISREVWYRAGRIGWSEKRLFKRCLITGCKLQATCSAQWYKAYLPSIRFAIFPKVL